MIHAVSHVDHDTVKQLHGVLFQSMHVCGSVHIITVFHLVTLWAAGALLYCNDHIKHRVRHLR